MVRLSETKHPHTGTILINSTKTGIRGFISRSLITALYGRMGEIRTIKYGPTPGRRKTRRIRGIRLPRLKGQTRAEYMYVKRPSYLRIMPSTIFRKVEQTLWSCGLQK